MTDVARLGDLLDRAAGIDGACCIGPGQSALAVPVLVMIGREHVAQGATDDALLIEAEGLIEEAMRGDLHRAGYLTRYLSSSAQNGVIYTNMSMFSPISAALPLLFSLQVAAIRSQPLPEAVPQPFPRLSNRRPYWPTGCRISSLSPMPNRSQLPKTGWRA